MTTCAFREFDIHLAPIVAGPMSVFVLFFLTLVFFFSFLLYDVAFKMVLRPVFFPGVPGAGGGARALPDLACG